MKTKLSIACLLACLLGSAYAEVEPSVANGCGGTGFEGKFNRDKHCFESTQKTGLVWGTPCYNDNSCNNKCNYPVVENQPHNPQCR